jgi:hypothetical protein
MSGRDSRHAVRTDQTAPIAASARTSRRGSYGGLAISNSGAGSYIRRNYRPVVERRCWRSANPGITGGNLFWAARNNVTWLHGLVTRLKASLTVLLLLKLLRSLLAGFLFVVSLALFVVLSLFRVVNPRADPLTQISSHY